uniref:Elongation of very long chain fatty acids protein n=1 Tax=Anopheles christyi TaxID=43041 RepID=A0A182KH71_9DIPT
MNIYNIIQIVLNLYIGIVGGLNSYFDPDYSWSCETINQKDNPIQFTILMLHFGIPLLGGYCDFPKVLLFIGFTQNMFMFTLFADFYIKTYIKKK